ncbi:MAG: glycosyltransferase family 4 protein [Thermoleophilia bacterium]|nr:glycosyltransferase family 4 protein [Thermoleophilia bacterium]
MKVLLPSRYSQLAASSRIRTYQYLPFLQSSGIEVTTSSLFDDEYILNLYAGKRVSGVSLLKAFAVRLRAMMQKKKFDLIWVEKEMLPWLPGWLEKLLAGRGTPWIIDYDDAIFHSYDRHKRGVVRAMLGQKIDGLMAHSSLVIAGNEYLASRARHAGAEHVEILPSVVDLERYTGSAVSGESHIDQHKVFSIGWMGSPATKNYLLVIRAALKEACLKDGVKLILVGLGNFELPDVHAEIRPWTEATEIEELRRFDAGIMPLADDDWSRGKCGYKLIQYMASSLPVIPSPVGANKDIIEDGVNGILASSNNEWVSAIRTLINDRKLGMSMGINGRKSVEARYCLQRNGPILADLMHEIAEAS